MITALFLVLVALTPLGFNLYMLVVAGFLDLMILGVANNALTSGDDEGDLTDWE